MAPRRSLRISAAIQETVQASSGPEKALKSRTESNRVAKSKSKKPTVTKATVTVTATTTTTKSKGKKKAAEKLPTESLQSNATDGPSTPKKRKRDDEKPALPSTPPPFFPDLKPIPASSAPPDLNRPVDPHRTTATLVTPHGSHVTAYPRTMEEASPSKTGLPRPTATTGNILEQGLAHLMKVAPKMRAMIEKHPDPPFSASHLAEEIDPFERLACGIIGQQVSGAAANSIHKKFVSLFPQEQSLSDPVDTKKENSSGRRRSAAKGDNKDKDKSENKDSEGNGNTEAKLRFPTPQEVITLDIPTLRSAGLSQRKAEYIHGLAEKFASGELSARMLLTASDEQVLETLIAVRGLGRWSVEMFSLFGLKRLDVFSTGDLGVQRGMAAFVGRDVAKLKAKGGKFKYMAEKEMVEIAAPFSPYRSLFMWYMWRWAETDIEVFQN
ncbi:3-methyladenine DNA glycosylase [Ophidiomyces ophidiicola]|uniref:3-methyladenine DNA glycosylase n=1 Tax=Ophidiomyces ophidiicola TaxID=1387563 RepID=UPI0020C55C91|nr:3-methyladenine DNA glycosylase [Ophidiomyces ophidiicola]KAI1940867.1 3-methyladenine DNA glycosylase [Ophidiomyces ophidiicola]KAI2060356.1 3-methyladenine DNA glycosylase [Ophidiomyces ophidiicola]